MPKINTLLAVILLLGLVACSDDTGPDIPPVVEAPEVATTAGECVAHFCEYYAGRQFDKYCGLLHEDFLFITQNQDGNYDRTAEIAIAGRMFNQVAGDGGIQIQDIIVDSMQPTAGSWETTAAGDPNFGGSLKRPYDIAINFIILNANTTYEVRGTVIFYVTSIEVEQSDGSTQEIYQLLGQHDHTFGGDNKATEAHSWSGVKALFN